MDDTRGDEMREDERQRDDAVSEDQWVTWYRDDAVAEWMLTELIALGVGAVGWGGGPRGADQPSRFS
jgi:hypothetical protein